MVAGGRQAARGGDRRVGPHGTPDALHHDRARQNQIVATGAILLRFTAADLRAGRLPATIARHVHRPGCGDAAQAGGLRWVGGR